MMESVIDYIVADLAEFAAATDADGGIADIIDPDGLGLDVVVFWGDPGIISVTNYPCFTVAPDRNAPTGGTTAAEFRDLNIVIQFLMDGREFFEASPTEANGDRTLVQVADRLEARMASKAKTLLDGMSGVRNASVSGTQYTPQPRGSVFAKSAVMTLTVNKSRPRTP